MTFSKVCTPIEHLFNCCCSMIHRFFESQISHKSTGGMSTQYDIHYFRFAIKREVSVTNSSLNRLVTDYLIIILYYTAYLFVRITIRFIIQAPAGNFVRSHSWQTDLSAAIVRYALPCQYKRTPFPSFSDSTSGLSAICLEDDEGCCQGNYFSKVHQLPILSSHSTG